MPLLLLLSKTRGPFLIGVALAVACSPAPTPGDDGLPGSGGETAAGGASSSGGAPASGGSSVGSSGANLGTGGASSGGAQSSGGAATGGSSTGGTGSASVESPGCGSPTPLESGTYTLEVDGTERQYVLDVPTDYDTSHAYRLVFVWHPLGGSASQVVNGGYDGLESRGEGSAIFVAPDGLVGSAAGVDGQGWYNTGGGDMAFLGQMLDHFQNSLCIDQSRIFSTGFSFGGMMSYAVGFEYGDVFRAIAPMSGNLQSTPHDELTTGPLAILALHGDVDDFVDTSGGFDALETYAARNHCPGQSAPVEPSPCVAYQGCDLPTVWCEFPGGHMPWSGAPDAIWAFFSQF